METSHKKAFLVCAAFLALVPTLAQEDTSPPALIEFSFRPASVDVTGGPASVTFTVRITDALSGVSGWALAVNSPSGTQGAGGYYWSPPVSGNPNDGVFEETIVLQQYAEAGTWKVVYVHLIDKVGNGLMLATDELAALNFPTTLTVTSMADTSPPVLARFEFSPTTVDTSSGPASVTFTAHITDELSGVSGWALAVNSPSGTQGVGGYYWSPPVSGDPNSGVFQETVVLPQYAEEGIWKVVYVYLFDKAGRQLMLGTEQLAALGFPTTLTVTSTPDTSPPVLAHFEFSPTEVDTSSGPASVTFTAHIIDELSGVLGWALAVTSPSGTQGAGGYYWSPPVSGDPNNGVFQETIVLPQYAEEGTWKVVYVHLMDRAGKQLMLGTDQLAALGFPTELVNGPQIIPVQIDIKPGSYPNSINLGSQGTVPVAIFSTPAFDARQVDPLSITLASATVALKGKGTPMASFEDVNRDGLLDLVVHVETQALQLTLGDAVVVLEGSTFDGRRIRGSDTVRVVP